LSLAKQKPERRFLLHKIEQLDNSAINLNSRTNVVTESIPDDDRELYSDTATYYSKYRPQYPAIFFDKAIAMCKLHPDSHLLEIGCGPGTATRPLLERGFRLTCIEPSSGMLAEAKLLCQEYQRVTFHQNTFQEFQGPSKFVQAVLAATSFHWVVDADSVEKIHQYLEDDGYLILLWNLPLEPEPAILDAVAQSTGRSNPFYFGGFSVSQHLNNIRSKVLEVVETGGLFGSFSQDEMTAEFRLSSTEYLSFLSTLSPYIRTPKKDREKFFREAKQVLDRFGERLTFSSTCILNVARKR
jgi:SAM-dependent methyltransferase